MSHDGIENQRRVQRQFSPGAPLFGREQEVTELTALITAERARLITLCGVGGAGKTRLALHMMDLVEDRFPDGAHLVPLAAVPDHAQVAATVAHHFGLGAADERSAPDRLKTFLADRRMLLVLDNFEHVTEAAALIADLLNVSPRLVVLITSRAPLRLFGERVFDIAPLPVHDLGTAASVETIRANPAVRLFVERAKASGASAEHLDDHGVAEICRRLEGLPLALELAATHARGLPLDMIARRLDQRLTMLAAGARDMPERLRTIEASIGWSYDLLTPGARQLFRRLSVFTGGFSLEMAVEMANGRAAGAGYPWAGIYDIEYPAKIWWGFDPTTERLEERYRRLDLGLPLSRIDIDPLDGIQTLVDQSLIRLEKGSDGAPRYAMLETLRAFGIDRLRESDEEEAVRHAHAVLVCSFVDATLPGLWTKFCRKWETSRVDDELGNIRTALAWTILRGSAASELSLRLASGLSLYFQFRGLVSEGIEWLEQALRDGQGPEWVRADSLISHAALCWIQGRDVQANESLREAVAIGERIGMKRAQAQATFYQSLIAWRQNDLPRMRKHVDRAFELFGEWQDIIGIGVCHLTYGVMERALGNLAGAERHLADARAFHDLVGYEWGLASGRYYGGEVARDLGNLHEAARMLRGGLNLYWERGDFWGAGASAGGLAVVASRRGRLQVAARLFGASDALCQRVGALVPPTELRAYAKVSAEVRERLGGPLFDLAFKEGQRSSPERCIEFCRAAAAGLLGETMDEPWASEANEATRARAALADLTPRRREILRLVIQGLEIKEIAHTLKRDYNTVDGQLKAIQKAFKVDSRTDLIVLVYKNGLAELI